MSVLFYSILLVAEIGVGFTAGTAFKAFGRSRSPLTLAVGLVGVVEVFALAYVAARML